jgi:hypothetical protein
MSWRDKAANAWEALKLASNRRYANEKLIKGAEMHDEAQMLNHYIDKEAKFRPSDKESAFYSEIDDWNKHLGRPEDFADDLSFLDILRRNFNRLETRDDYWVGDDNDAAAEDCSHQARLEGAGRASRGEPITRRNVKMTNYPYTTPTKVK